ncbi:AAA family ATPase [Anabaena sp. CCY 9910]|uniref:AAA family ATPase n=1 Tax=Anabaena sp. CCY 9910 TaxID=3103870 RepID=UPI0039DF3CC6
MVAANLVAKDKRLDENNIFSVDAELSLLKSAAIYGANASGKSNLARAMTFMKWFMINSSKGTQITEKIDVEPFRLSIGTESRPSYFEIVFLLDEQKYRYGFEATQDKVVSEWLFYVPKVRETNIFKRDHSGINFSKIYKADGIQQKTRHNALFLSVSAQFNVNIAEKILNWVTSQLKIVSGLNDNGYQGYTSHYLVKSNVKRDAILKLIGKLDLGIGELDIEEVGSRESLLDKTKNLPDEFKELFNKVAELILDGRGEAKTASIKTLHHKFDDNGVLVGKALFDLNSDESEGTKKIFAISGLLVDSLQEGKTLVIDEFDARLHPLISYAIVELFNSNETNPNNSQLIFITHDTNLLTNKLFRRDQIWFTEKNRYGVTDLYSLAEYKVRNDVSFENDYIKGRYGAIPYIGDLVHLLDAHG